MSTPTFSAGQAGCDVPDCDRTRVCKGYCNRHYLRFRRYGDPLSGAKERRAAGETCVLCDQPNFGDGLCRSHYDARRRNGDPTIRKRWRATGSPLDRFLAGLIRRGDDECWTWRGTKGGSRGYGRLSVNGKLVNVHRFSYEHFVGPIPKGLVLDHLCENKGCLNYHHLEPVTIYENVRRGILRAATPEDLRFLTKALAA